MASRERILEDIYTLDPSLRQRSADVERVVDALLSARPNVTADRAFVAELRARVMMHENQKEAVSLQSDPLWYTFLLRFSAPIAVVALIVVVVLPSMERGPVGQYTSIDSGVDTSKGMGGDTMLREGFGGGAEPMSAPETTMSTMDGDMGAGEAEVTTLEYAQDESVADDAVMMAVEEERGELGFIRAVDPEARTVMFDRATWLSGRAGEDAAIAAGLCTEATRSECLLNDYFIENADTTTVPLALLEDVTVIMQTYDAGPYGIGAREISLPTFASLINDEALHWNTLPYTVTLEQDAVVSVEEVYIP